MTVPIPICFPIVRYRPTLVLPDGQASTLRELCVQAETVCKASGAWCDRRVGYQEDMSNGDAVEHEAIRVFAQYGNIATSGLDGLELLRRVKDRRLLLLKCPGLAAAWKTHRGGTDEERAVARQHWTEALRQDSDVAIEVGRQIGGYLTDQRLAKNLMRVDPADRDADWLSFLREIHTMLRTSAAASGAAEMLFNARDIGMDDADLMVLSQHGAVPTCPPLPVTGAQGMKQDWDAADPATGVANGPATGASVLDDIDRRQAVEDERADRSARVQTFVAELFGRIDDLSRADNNDEFCKRLRDVHHVWPRDEMMVPFRRLFNAAISRDPNRRDPINKRLRELAIGRLGLLLGDYCMRTTGG